MPWHFSQCYSSAQPQQINQLQQLAAVGNSSLQSATCYDESSCMASSDPAQQPGPQPESHHNAMHCQGIEASVHWHRQDGLPCLDVMLGIHAQPGVFTCLPNHHIMHLQCKTRWSFCSYCMWRLQHLE